MKVRTQIQCGAACYIVQSGDTLSGIASQFGSSVQAIYQSNLTTIGSDPNLILPGQKLYIPD
jgi:resuscitation-promoting factor RpfA